jgi:2-polyprenyl-3-methyl-5-hydroxy-6-metoxy-1,4-benzoquinol methylase
MSESWDGYAESWDSNSDAITYSQKAFGSLCAFADLNGLKVLDFGCGTGLLTEKIASIASSVLAVDSSPKMIDVISEKNLPNVKVLVCEITEESIESNPILQSRFDLIVASSVCAFVPDYEKTVTDLKSLLKPAGTFIQWDWKRTDAEPDFGFTENIIRNAYSSVGLTPLEIMTAFSLSNEKGSMDVIMGVGKNA